MERAARDRAGGGVSGWRGRSMKPGGVAKPWRRRNAGGMGRSAAGGAAARRQRVRAVRRSLEAQTGQTAPRRPQRHRAAARAHKKQWPEGVGGRAPRRRARGRGRAGGRGPEDGRRPPEPREPQRVQSGSGAICEAFTGPDCRTHCASACRVIPRAPPARSRASPRGRHAEGGHGPAPAPRAGLRVAAVVTGWAVARQRRRQPGHELPRWKRRRGARRPLQWPLWQPRAPPGAHGVAGPDLLSRGGRLGARGAPPPPAARC
jgi:hypothetical protein